MAVRPRKDRDLPAIVAALRSVYRSDGYPMLWPADPAGWLTPDGHAAGWVAEVGGVVVGHVGLVAEITDELVSDLLGVRSAQLASITRLFVRGEARGQGVGAALLSAASAHAHDLRLTLTLDVVEDGGTASAFYQRLGWRLLAQREAHWTTPAGARPLVSVYASPKSAGDEPNW